MLPIHTSPEVADLNADTAVLPVGSYEQHGPFLPLSTDALIATAVAERIADDYGLFRLPAVTLGCSHEHARFAGTVSVSARTLYAIVDDTARSLQASGIRRLVVVNAHGGNYVLSNVVQEANVSSRRMVLYPTSDDWKEARASAHLQSTNHEDMHAGEAETSILLYRFPEAVRDGYENADNLADDRRLLLLEGTDPYAPHGVIGVPSAATAEKGRALLDAFSRQFKVHLAALRAEA